MVSSSPKMTTMPAIDDDTLQRYYDGDLPAVERHELEARLAADPGARARLKQLEALSLAFRDSAEELARDLDSRALLAAIEREIASAPRPSTSERMKVRAAEWTSHRRGAVVRMVAATAVAAATLLVVLRPPPAPDLEPEPTRQPAPPEQPAAEPEPEPLVHGTQVEDVDLGTRTGTVFEVDNRGVGVAVLWISDDDDDDDVAVEQPAEGVVQ